MLLLVYLCSPFQLPANTNSGRWKLMAQAHGSLPLTEELHWVPGFQFQLAQPWPLQLLVDRSTFSLLSLFLPTCPFALQISKVKIKSSQKYLEKQEQPVPQSLKVPRASASQANTDLNLRRKNSTASPCLLQLTALQITSHKPSINTQLPRLSTYHTTWLWGWLLGLFLLIRKCWP